MKQIPNLSDKRQTSHCIYCGDLIETKEHVPSKIFLDEPYPENLHTVPACTPCNESFSVDEEFVSCFIEFLVANCDTTQIKRPKIKKVLAKKPGLIESFDVNDVSNIDKMKSIFHKIALGHYLYERNEIPDRDNVRVSLGLVQDLENLEEFESIPYARLAPEVGSRAMHRMVVAPILGFSWVPVQVGRYRFIVFEGGVRMVFSEYLWCEVIWQET